MGGHAKKTGKGRLDKFYHAAKEQGYRSRAAFKLVQINRKYDVLKDAKVCIDLCAAPGGWLQVASKYMPVSSMIIGVDLDPIRPIKGCITLVNDITTQSCREQLKARLKAWKADIVLHDGAPNVGGAWAKDAYIQNELVLHSMKLATEFLTKGGSFVTKVFRSADYDKLMWVFEQLFGRVEAYKPSSSRDVSAEIFVICRDYYAPKKLDARFTDPKFVFKNSLAHTPEPQDILTSTKRKHRTGYVDGDSLIHGHDLSAAAFARHEDPNSILTTTHRITFPETDGSVIMLEHPSTTPVIREFCQDLQIIGKSDFRKLLAWGKKMAEFMVKLRQQRDAGNDADSESSDYESDYSESDSDVDEHGVSKSLTDILTKQEREKVRAARRARNKLRKNAAKEKYHKSLGMIHDKDVGILETDERLFSAVKLAQSDARRGRRDAKKAAQEAQEARRVARDTAGQGSDSDSDTVSEMSESESDIDDQGDVSLLIGKGVKERWQDQLLPDLTEEQKLTMTPAQEESYRVSQMEAEANASHMQLEEMKGNFVQKKAKPGKRDYLRAREKLDIALDETALDLRRARLPAPDLTLNPLRALSTAVGKSGRRRHRRRDAFGNVIESSSVGPRTAPTVMKAATTATATEEADGARDALTAEQRSDAVLRFRQSLFGSTAASMAGAPGAAKRTPTVAGSAAVDMRLSESAMKKQALAHLQAANGGVSRVRFDSDSEEDVVNIDAPVTRSDAADGVFRGSKAAKSRLERRGVKLLNKATRAKRKRGAAGADIDAESMAIVTAKLKGRKYVEKKVEGMEESKRGEGFEEVQQEVIDSDFSEEEMGAGGVPGSEYEYYSEYSDDTSDEEDEDAFGVNAEREEAEKLKEEFVDDQAETLAIGQMMMRRRSKQQLVDDSYNRYAFNDGDDLPAWFENEESNHNRPLIPVTKEMVNIQKAKWQEVSARPIKKIAEAKARKKMKAVRRIQRLQAQAGSVLNNEDMSGKSKARAMEKLMNKMAKKSTGPRFSYVRNIKGKMQGGKNVKMLDKRMKTDLRGLKRAKRREKKW